MSTSTTNAVSMANATCFHFSRHDLNIDKREDSSHSDHHTLTLHGEYREYPVFVELLFNENSGAYDGTYYIDTGMVYITEEGEEAPCVGGGSLRYYCTMSRDSDGICQPETIAKRIVGAFDNHIFPD